MTTPSELSIPCGDCASTIPDEHGDDCSIHTDHPVHPTPGSREWAINAARQDGSFLITPRAREKALAILKDDTTELGECARTILYDGGNQQGGNYPAVRFDDWVAAAKRLGVFDE